jgi:rare lipoprotein A (peptidoglycan hydrolase)
LTASYAYGKKVLAFLGKNMKAKTKRRVIHVLTKKKLVKKKTSRTILRSFLVGLATLSVSSLAYAITLNKPTVSVNVHSYGAGGIDIAANPTPTPASAGGPVMSGRASWYALGLPEPDALTCASRTFPRGTYVHVLDKYNGNTVICRVNDYGPEAWTGRVLDLSRGSFRVIDSLGTGTIPVDLSAVAGPTGIRYPVDEYIFSAVIGYNSCHKAHDPKFCDSHRQD